MSSLISGLRKGKLMVCFWPQPLCLRSFYHGCHDFSATHDKSQHVPYLARFLEHKVRLVEYNSGNEANLLGSKRFVVQKRRLGWNTIG